MSTNGSFPPSPPAACALLLSNRTSGPPPLFLASAAKFVSWWFYPQSLQIQLPALQTVSSATACSPTRNSVPRQRVSQPNLCLCWSSSHTQGGQLGCGCLLSPFLWTWIRCGCISSRGQLSAPILSFQGFHRVTRVTKSLPCLLSPSVCWVSSLTCPLMVTMQLPWAREPHSWAVSVCSWEFLSISQVSWKFLKVILVLGCLDRESVPGLNWSHWPPLWFFLRFIFNF